MFGGFAAVIVAFATGLAHNLDSRQLDVILRTLSVIALCAFFAAWVPYAFTWFMLIRFRCPRCGKRFMSFLRWPENHCKHCGLDLDKLATDKARREVDLFV
jgi:hypothetical protein